MESEFFTKNEVLSILNSFQDKSESAWQFEARDLALEMNLCKDNAGYLSPNNLLRLLIKEFAKENRVRKDDEVFLGFLLEVGWFSWEIYKNKSGYSPSCAFDDPMIERVLIGAMSGDLSGAGKPFKRAIRKSNHLENIWSSFQMFAIKEPYKAHCIKTRSEKAPYWLDFQKILGKDEIKIWETDLMHFCAQYASQEAADLIADAWSDEKIDKRGGDINGKFLLKEKREGYLYIMGKRPKKPTRKVGEMSVGLLDFDKEEVGSKTLTLHLYSDVLENKINTIIENDVLSAWLAHNCLRNLIMNDKEKFGGEILGEDDITIYAGDSGYGPKITIQINSVQNRKDLKDDVRNKIGKLLDVIAEIGEEELRNHWVSRGSSSSWPISEKQKQTQDKIFGMWSALIQRDAILGEVKNEDSEGVKKDAPRRKI